MKKIESKIIESTVQEVNVVIPPDGGYAWVVVFGAFISNFVVDGISFSFGVSMLTALSNALDLPATKIATISSVQLGTYYLFGPAACAFVNHFGFRLVGICGCLISVIGSLVASYVESYAVIITFYGVIGGIGFGMVYTASVICVGYYFEKYRALSTGIAVCGSSVGGLCLSPLFAYLVINKGWQYTMRVQSGLLCICFLSSMTFRPIKPTQVPLTPEIITEIDQLATPSRVEFVELYKTTSMVSIDLQTPSEESRHFPQISIISSRFLPISKMAKNNNQRRCSLSCLRKLCRTEKPDGHENVILTGPIDRKDIFYSASVVHLPEYKIMKRHESTKNTKPMLSYHLSMILDPKTMTSPTEMPFEEMRKHSRRCFGVSHKIQKALGMLFDVSLLKSLVFCILAVACICYALAWLTPYNYLPLRATMNNIDQSYIRWFVSCISIGNAIGRITAGVIATIFPRLNPCYMVGYGTIAGGIITILSALLWTDDANFQIIYCVLFGFFIAFLSAMRPIVFVKLLGLDKLTNAFGLSAVAIGIAVLSGLPIASALFELTESLLPSFLLSGILFILCGLLVILAFHVYLMEERRKISKK